MKKILLILLTLLFSQVLTAYFDWQCVKTDQFTVFYGPGFEERARYLLATLENNKQIPERITGNRLAWVPVLLEDAGEYNQGYADPAYFRMSVFNYEYNEPWFRMVGIHEYTHMLQMTETRGIPTAFTFLFGSIMSPNIFMPLWVHEGITTYDESQASQYTGRLNTGGFDAYMGACVSENKMPSIMKATYDPMEAPYGQTPYLFGGEFTQYLSKTYGEEKLKELYADIGGNVFMYLSPVFPFLGMDQSYRNILGKRTDELWQDFLEGEKIRFKDFKMDGERLTNRGYYTNSLVLSGEKLYYSSTTLEKTGPYSLWVINRIVERDIKTGNEKEIVLRTGQVLKAMKTYGGKLYYTVHEIKPGYANTFNGSFGYYSVVYERDIASGDEREIARGEMNAFCVINGKLLYSVNKPYTYGSEIYLKDLDTMKAVKLPDIDRVIFDFAVTDDDEGVYVSAKKEEENLSLFYFEYKKGYFTAVADTPWSEEKPAIYGDRLFYSADYGKAVKNYCYDLKAKTFYALTGSGFAQEAAYDAASGDIYFIGINTDGFDLYRKKADFKKFALPADKADDYVNRPLDPASVSKGSYLDNLATLWPKIRVPFIYVDDNSNTMAGFTLMGSDAMGDLTYTAEFSYNLAKKTVGETILLTAGFLNPLRLEAQFNNTLDRDARIGVAYPLYTSVIGGLSNITIGAQYRRFEDLTKNGYNLNLKVDSKWPLTQLYLVGVAEARPENDIDFITSKRVFGYTIARLVQHFPYSNLIIDAVRGFSGKPGAGFVFKARGYDDGPYDHNMTALNAQITAPLLKLRFGLWNPNIYFEDICVNLFCDSVFTGGETQLSGGGGLQLETKLLFIASTTIGVEAVHTKEKGAEWIITYNLGFVSFGF